MEAQSGLRMSRIGEISCYTTLFIEDDVKFYEKVSLIVLKSLF